MFQLIYPHSSPLKTIFKIVLCAAKHKWEFFGHFSNSSGKVHSGISLRDRGAAAKFHYISMLFAQFKFNDPTIISVWTKKLSFWLGTITLFCDLLPTKITIEKMHRFCLQISQGTIATLSKTIDTVFKHQMIDDSDPWSITICHTTSTTIHTEKKGFLHKGS